MLILLFRNHDTPGSSNGGSCAPDGDDGNYIMYLRATDGDKANNDRFSPCSVGSMNSVLMDNAGCFTTRETQECGLSLLPEGRAANSILEFGEECECTDASLVTESFCVCATSLVEDGKVCSPENDPACCKADGTLRGLDLKTTLDNYRAAFAAYATAVALDPSTSVTASSALQAEMKYPGGGDVEKCGTTPDCLLPRYCINDEQFVPYRGQIYGSCPMADLVAELNNTVDQLGAANDFNICFNFSFSAYPDRPPELAPPAVRSCTAVVADQINPEITVTEPEACYLFHKSDADSCNEGSSLCRYNGCTGSICDNYGTYGPDGQQHPTERATPCASIASACAVACRFASTEYLGVNPAVLDSEGRGLSALSVCTVLGAAEMASHYPNYNVSQLRYPLTPRSLPDGRSCNFDGPAGSGKCNAGSCEEYGGDLGDTFDPDAVAGWIVENWETVLIFVLVMIFVIVLLKCTYHKNKKQIRKGVRRAGARVAKTLGGKGGGGGAKPSNSNINSKQDPFRTLSRGMTAGGGAPTVLTTQMRNDMRKVIRKEEQLMRLQAFFPNTKDKTIEYVQNRCTDEKDMVKRLLKSREGIFIPKGPPVLLD